MFNVYFLFLLPLYCPYCHPIYTGFLLYWYVTQQSFYSLCNVYSLIKMCILFIISPLYFNVYFLSNFNPSVLCIMFSSYGIFLHVSYPTLDSRIFTYVMYHYLNLIHILCIFDWCFSIGWFVKNLNMSVLKFYL